MKNLNNYDILTVSEGPQAAADLTSMMAVHLERGWMPWQNVMAHYGLVMQAIETNETGKEYSGRYELKLLQALSPNELVTQVRDLQADGWELYLNMVSGERYIFQWMLRAQQNPETQHAQQGDISMDVPAHMVVSATPLLRFQGPILAGDA